MATTTVAVSSVPFTLMSRPQIGIDRLPVNRRPSNNEPREVMNCKSCRKRKIKCNRLKPTCEACQVFNCPCVYDAVPKKRGPKTDVLEALLKRVNGLEKRLQDKEGPGSSDQDAAVESESSANGSNEREEERNSSEPASQPPAETNTQPKTTQTVLRPAESRPEPQDNLALKDALLDTYFTRLHGKPFYILDEPATRQRLRDGLLPRCLFNAIYAVSIRYVPHICGGHNVAVTQSINYASQSRMEVDVDEPSIDHLQALLLLSMASFQSGRGKKSYMLLSHAVSMAFALNLHRELPTELRIANNEREGRRKLFWTCYMMDRLTASGSKRPALMSDESISLRLPAWKPQGSNIQSDGNYFPNGSSLPYAAGVSNAGQGSGAMLIEIVRILGVTNRYLADGGVKSDSHFPWHAQSTLSRIRSSLDEWASSTQDAFSSLDSLFGQRDSSTMVLSKLIYHLIHCLIYRPFLPIDLAELSGTSQHQSWQIEATNLCFLHANAIAELAEIGKNTSTIDWPSFVGYCICTAGTIHVHGAHYIAPQQDDVYANSSDFLSREMAQLADLRYTWAGVQNQRQTLQMVYGCHMQLVESLAANPMRFSPVFQMEDFFERYTGSYIDGAYMSFVDVDPHGQDESQQAYNPSPNWTRERTPIMYPPTPQQRTAAVRPAKKRRTESTPYPVPSIEKPAQNNQGDRRATMVSYVPNEEQQPTRPNLPEEPTENHNDGQFQEQTFTQSALSPNFSFSPLPQDFGLTNGNTNGQWHDFHGQGFEYRSPGGFSQGADSANTDPDKDPFLGLLEQLAQNDGGEGGDSRDLDYFLKGEDLGQL